MARCRPLLSPLSLSVLLLLCWTAEGSQVRGVPNTLASHMQRLYHKYTRPGHQFKDGNTVRSFSPFHGFLGTRRVHIFNLTSLRREESVLSATLHFYTGEQTHRSSAHYTTGPSPSPHPAHQLLVWSLVSATGPALAHVCFDVPHVRTRGAAWQWRDVTRLVKAAAGKGAEILIAAHLDSNRQQQQRPYLLLYANDSAIERPESVGGALRRHHQGTAETTPLRPLATLLQPPATPLQPQNSSRARRSVNLLSPLQNNELPEPESPREPFPEEFPDQDLGGERGGRARSWAQAGSFGPFAPKNKNGAVSPKSKKKKNRKDTAVHKGELLPKDKGQQKGALLRFDERTLKKARRKWAEPRGCSRRYLKVDFADIGWSDWIISPKAYDAFYCSGSCQFPMNKAMRPSNHATLQSIVRAVGVVPGVPEPCCVPEKMTSLSILFFDDQANVVLKVYPNMSVETCACR